MRGSVGIVVAAVIAVAAIGARLSAAGVSLPQIQKDRPAPVVLTLPADIDAPYVGDAATMAELDRVDPGGDCNKSGKLAFGCLIQAKLAPADRQALTGKQANPFALDVTTTITKTILGDLGERQHKADVESSNGIDVNFLADPNSRLELVGIINRMDRQFVTDPRLGQPNGGRPACGEISLIYRFSYKILRTGDPGAILSQSRLPVTMNVVLPAVPGNRPGEAACKEAASRWKTQLEILKGLSGGVDRARALSDPATGILPLIDGRDIRRIELNIQAFRKPAKLNEGHFGSTAEYVIRVFQWNDAKGGRGSFGVSFLANQIDRARFFNAVGDENSCDKDEKRPPLKDAFLKYLRDEAVIHDIDYGTLDIPQRFLACRAISVSPGGEARSGNQPFWDASTATTSVGKVDQILTDDDLKGLIALANANKSAPLLFISTPDDMRMRLNEQSCTGCHQTRAIAGFHFPGEDRSSTAPSNAVLLPGSPHFYGDQARREAILDGLANTGKLSRYDLRAGFASRTQNRYRDQYASTQLIGGWGAACLMPNKRATDGRGRDWGCSGKLECRQVYRSDSAAGLGVCLPPEEEKPQIGDPLQFGTVTSTKFGDDHYVRTSVVKGATFDPKSALIDVSWMTAINNQYYASHQEFYQGGYGEKPAFQKYGDDYFVAKRDSETGGFPGGALRLSECSNLPGEATCGLIASSGFNDCIGLISNDPKGKRLADCFAERTSYAGIRACDVSRPCRDDYICLKPMDYSKDNFEKRRKRVDYDLADYGQREPDGDWVGLNDRRGVCIPPYFVFQFRADGHPKAPGH